MLKATIIAFAFFSIFGFTSARRSDTILKNQEAGQAEYDLLNRAYFDGNLSQNVIVAMDAPDSVIGQTSATGDGFIIHLNPEKNNDPRLAQATVVHETCHIAEWRWLGLEDAHGPHWQQCMKNLANEGALSDIW